MIKSKEELRYYIHEDAKANRMDCSTIRYWLRLMVGSESAHVYKYLKILRHCEYHSNNHNVINKLLYHFYKIKLHRLGLKLNIRIPENICGYGLSIVHIAGCGGCLVNAKKVGNYCKLQTGVLLGNKNHSEEEKPTIGDYVEFGPGAKVLGKVIIGDNCFIAANAVVVKDVAPNSIVGGVPAKYISNGN